MNKTYLEWLHKYLSSQMHTLTSYIEQDALNALFVIKKQEKENKNKMYQFYTWTHWWSVATSQNPSTWMPVWQNQAWEQVNHSARLVTC
jgi:hypothetical protein